MQSLFRPSPANVPPWSAISAGCPEQAASKSENAQIILISLPCFSFEQGERRQMRAAHLYGAKHRGFGRKMLTTNPFDDDTLREECGIFGIWGAEGASSFVALGLHALQHRGQEAAGIVSFDGTNYHAHRAMGHVAGN